jgi:hypothetical protein
VAFRLDMTIRHDSEGKVNLGMYMTVQDFIESSTKDASRTFLWSRKCSLIRATLLPNRGLMQGVK